MQGEMLRKGIKQEGEPFSSKKKKKPRGKSNKIRE